MCILSCNLLLMDIVARSFVARSFVGGYNHAFIMHTCNYATDVIRRGVTITLTLSIPYLDRSIFSVCTLLGVVNGNIPILRITFEEECSLQRVVRDKEHLLLVKWGGLTRRPVVPLSCSASTTTSTALCCTISVLECEYVCIRKCGQARGNTLYTIPGSL